MSWSSLRETRDKIAKQFCAEATSNPSRSQSRYGLLPPTLCELRRTGRFRSQRRGIRPRTALLRCRLQLHLFRAHGAELEFGNLAERIKRRVGQEVRRRFRV